MTNYIGCSGFSYDDWKGEFYPEDVPKKKWLEYYAKKFNSVEINSSFYHLPKEKTLKDWHERVPGNFRFTLKGSRFVTHMKKLNQTGEAVKNFYERAAFLKGKLGCILWQLPGNQHKDTEKLKKFCKVLSSDFRNVIEFRHNSWYDPEVYDVMRQKGVIFCVISAPVGLSEEAMKTAGPVYMRFHGRGDWYRHLYTQEELKHWARKLNELEPEKIFAYFNNDFRAYAPRNAAMFKDLIS